MLALFSASAPHLKNFYLTGLRTASIHVSSICCEKRADKFRSYYAGESSKEYLNYVKRKRRAAQKRECSKWRSCEVFCDFDKLFWSRGMYSCKMRKGGSYRRNTYFKDFYDFDSVFGTKSKKRSNRRAQEDAFEYIWQSASPFYTYWWEDFCNEDIPFGYEFPFNTGKRCGSFNQEGFSSAHGKTSANQTSNNDENPGKRKVKVEPLTIGSPSDRQTLGLCPYGSLTVEQLKKAFRASALKWHPDRHEDAAKVKAEAKFKDCGAAYKSLLNALTKA
ncbi:hypothetical protein KP509_21G054900 [Ceratopteris richardii]|uniref:J domain-containing protein n=1 Tax=Ceratopteris richardii TaxID=49495 RepID=A0A8T2SDH2_CERRI|nr:hypothetical protein KP509_21G054900 [Ceratopteris richardii]